MNYGQTLIRFLAAVCLAVPSAGPVIAQLSPGPLSRTHENLDTALKCLECHGGEQSMQERCMDCHKAIAFLSLKGRGLHGRTGDRECSGCHVEHAGRDFSLIFFEEGTPEQFNHGRTGWQLEGKHAERRCQDCHKPQLQKSDVLEMSSRKNPENSYLGLETTCISCHTDVHREALGPNCGECHTPASWKDLPNFDHARTGYPLTGKHATVKCEQCHKTSESKSAETRTPLRHDECSSCHKDAHQGRLGPRCSDCHVTTGFRDRGRKAFDHALTDYPLAGKHATVKCEQCHKTAKRPAHDRCLDCHTDQHGGQLASRTDGGECASCHQVAGWTPTTFTAQDHDRLQFPLQGRHRTIRCALCHRPAGSRPAPAEATAPTAIRTGPAKVALRLGDPECTACHVDPHAGRLAVALPGGREPTCTACHGQQAFRPSTLTARTHGALGFPLTGAHATTPCIRCHEGLMRRPPESVPEPDDRMATDAAAADRSMDSGLAFPADPRCVTCHFNPHGGQFLARRDGGSCDSCHDGTSFRPAVKFDHNRSTRFPLLRAHNNVPCGKCHTREQGDTGLAVVNYRPVSLDCRECHRRTAVAVNGRAGRFPNQEPPQ